MSEGCILCGGLIVNGEATTFVNNRNPALGRAHLKCGNVHGAGYAKGRAEGKAEEQRLTEACIARNKTITMLKEELKDQEDLRTTLRRQLDRSREHFFKYGLHTPTCGRWGANFEDIGEEPPCGCGFDEVHAIMSSVHVGIEPIAERIARWVENYPVGADAAVMAQAIRDGKYR